MINHLWQSVTVADIRLTRQLYDIFFLQLHAKLALVLHQHFDMQLRNAVVNTHYFLVLGLFVFL